MEKKFEKIGKVNLDLSYYSGDDLYSEGAAEDDLLNIVKTEPASRFNRIIAERANWNTLYHLSDKRGNIADFIHIQKNQKVLEIGSGCGAVTGTLADRAESVTCIELSHKRSLINAYRNKDYDNLNIIVGNFEDIEPDLEDKYDYIFLIGVLEYSGSYIHAEDPYQEMLKRLSGHLSYGGEIVVAIENKYGMKYLAGCREDHTGKFYDGVEGYTGNDKVCTFSKKGIIELAKNTKLRADFYYPYPDYKLPTTIFSDERLPFPGELNDNIRNFDADRFVAFDEGKAYREVLKEGVFSQLSNSFLVFLSKEDRIESFKVKKTLFSKHSDERDPKYQIRTDIMKDGYHKKFVMKYPKTSAAQKHLLAMYNASTRLSSSLESKTVAINKAKLVTDENGEFEGIQFEYLEGRTLGEVLVDYYRRGRRKTAEKILKQYASFIRGRKPIDLDLILSNIMITSDGRWNITDYEWIDDKADPEFIIYRAAKYFIEENPGVVSEPELYGVLELDLSARDEFEGKELALQHEIAGEHASLKTMYDIFGRGCVTLSQAIKGFGEILRPANVKVFFDMGDGFIGSECLNFTGKSDDEMRVILDMPIAEGTKRLRVDPVEAPCMVRLISATVPDATVNGHVCNNTVVFETDDPQFIFDKIEGKPFFHMEYMIQTLNKDLFSDIGKKLGEYETPAPDIFGKRQKKKEYDKVSAVDRKN